MLIPAVCKNKTIKGKLGHIAAIDKLSVKSPSKRLEHDESRVSELIPSKNAASFRELELASHPGDLPNGSGGPAEICGSQQSPAKCLNKSPRREGVPLPLGNLRCDAMSLCYQTDYFRLASKSKSSMICCGNHANRSALTRRLFSLPILLFLP